MPASPRRPPRRPPGLAAILLALLGAPAASPGGAASGAAASPGPPPPPPPLAAVTIVGPETVLFDARRDGCDEVDQPDAPLRAFRDAAGGVAAFGLHWRNRALRGPDLDHLAIDCRVVLDSHGRDDPALYDDRSWITATWTDDGRRVAALLHHEYQAHEHPGRCRFGEYLACWYNTIVAARSADGGLTFARDVPPVVVAGAPFRQEVDQGRHRGFFNPSNIVADGRWRYALVFTTGWPGQAPGACLLRSDDPADPRRWRAFDGADFTVRYADLYATRPAPSQATFEAPSQAPSQAPSRSSSPPPCRPVGPFTASVGGLVRHRGTGAWIAVFQASVEPGRFAEAGFYATSSRDLLTWDVPRLILAGATHYDDPCRAGGRLIAYPTLIDAGARGRNFDDVGDRAELTYTVMRTEGCAITADRSLVRRPVAIKVWP